MTLKRVERGIYVRDGGVLYVLYVNERGETVWKSTKQKSVKAARKVLEKCKTEVSLRVNLPTRRYEAAKFSELAGNWWDREGSRNMSQWKYLVPRITDAFGKLKARQVTSDAVQDFLDGLRRTLSASSCNHFRTILNRIFNYSIERQAYDFNPVKAVKQYREPPGRDRFPTVDEVRKLMEKLADDPEVLAAVMVLATTTMRKGEILKRKWYELHLEGTPAYVSVMDKNGHVKKIPIPHVAAAMLKALPRTSEWVFPSKPTARWPEPRKAHRWDIGKEFRAACKAAGIENLHVHDLRHMGISILTEQGLADNIIRKLSGHRGRQLERYQHLSAEFKARTVDAIAATLIPGEEEKTPDGETVH